MALLDKVKYRIENRKYDMAETIYNLAYKTYKENIDKYKKRSKHFVSRMCNTKNGNYICMYLMNIPTNEKEKDMLISTICELKEETYIITLAKNIRKIDLSKKNINDLVGLLCNIGSSYGLYMFTLYLQNAYFGGMLDVANINKIVKALCGFKDFKDVDSKNLYLFIKNIRPLTDDNTYDLFKKLYEIRNNGRLERGYIEQLISEAEELTYGKFDESSKIKVYTIDIPFLAGPPRNVFSNKINLLQSRIIDLSVDVVCESNSSYWIFEYERDTSFLKLENKEKLAKAMCNTKDKEMIKNFAYLTLGLRGSDNNFDLLTYLCDSIKKNSCELTKDDLEILVFNSSRRVIVKYIILSENYELANKLFGNDDKFYKFAYNHIYRYDGNNKRELSDFCLTMRSNTENDYDCKYIDFLLNDYEEEISKKYFI